MFSAISEKPFYIFAACNVFSLPMVWALYPEGNQRTLEEMELLFAADSPWVWAAEREFARLKAENPDLVSAASRGNSIVDPEMGTMKAGLGNERVLVEGGGEAGLGRGRSG
ncbi:hypothetical protein LTR62_006028 [Meristemomyces frigidus]|uniref:Uncharacterized protein n=1 Tax=Meristemomyces frigidus TaxID=1508187 RepID=A0AAN7TW63_9PEZI|nr:hypothetical protein LTR62_006028 [Meristemomyces frigidus]